VSETRRFIVVRAAGRESRVEITGCYWCGAREDAICGVCAAKANDARERLSKENDHE
jgi:hypothetical protein